KYTFGNLAMGKNTADYRLELWQTDNTATRTLNIYSDYAGAGINSNIFNENNFTGNGTTRNMYNFIGGSGDGLATSIYNNNTSTGDGIHYGIFTQLAGGGSGDHIGNFNNVVTNSNTNNLVGVRNTLAGASNDGDHTGVENNLNSTGDGTHTGVQNTFSGTNPGSTMNGIDNNMTNARSVFQTGILNTMDNTITAGTRIGLDNTITSSTSGNYTGVFNTLSSTGGGNLSGTRTFISGSNNSDNFGHYVSIDGTGIGRQFGYFSIINPVQPGPHYGVYSEALRTTGTTFAGFFAGSVAVGTEAFGSVSPNYYVLPAARGSADQVMQTDGSGNLSWVDPSALADDDWVTVGAAIERQSGDVYIGDNGSSTNDLYISDRLVDWDNPTYYIDPSELSRVDEISFDGGFASDASINFGTQNTGFYSPSSNVVSYTVGGEANMNWINNTNGVFRIELINNNDNILIGQNTGNTLSNTVVDNIAIGNRALQSNNTGVGNVAVGERTLGQATSEYNTAIGTVALGSLTSGQDNVAVGGSSLFHLSGGSENIAIGRTSGFNVTGSENVFVGYRAGYAASSRSISGSVFIGNEAGSGISSSNRLYLDNSSTTNPLLYGEFDNNLLRTNGEFQIGNPITTGYAFPTVDGTANQVLQTDGSGALSWVANTDATGAANGLSLSVNNVILGGSLNQSTTIAQGIYNFTHNLTSTGDFFVADNGTNVFEIDNDGTAQFGDDVFWRDGSTTGTIIASLEDDGNDGRFRVYENGLTMFDLDANTGAIFNEQGANRDFRIESDDNSNMFVLDASVNAVGINTLTPSTAFHVNHPTGTTNGLSISNATDTDRWHFYTFTTNDLHLYFNNANRGSFDDVSGTYTPVSDRNLKTDIAPIGNLLDRVMQLEVVDYRFKGQIGSKRYLGFIAQDVEQQFPQVVKKPELRNGESSTYMMDYSAMGTVAIKAIQEQQKIIETQQTEIDALKEEIKAIKAMIRQ
ncbi:MAG: tail fiber domain-containing protein, partial [Bacteroidota bacterium]